jgi:hypothetical protein
VIQLRCAFAILGHATDVDCEYESEDESESESDEEDESEGIKGKDEKAQRESFFDPCVC